jgi:CHAT domain-containing protein
MVGSALTNLGSVVQRQGRNEEAEALYKRALTIREAALGPGHPDVAATLNNLAHVYSLEGRYADALDIMLRVVAIREKTLSPNHPDVALGYNNLGSIYRLMGDRQNALTYSRKSTAALVGHAIAETAGIQGANPGSNAIERAGYLSFHLSDLVYAFNQRNADRVAISHEAIEVAQWASRSSAAAAVQQMAARFAAGSGPLATLVRENQDLAATWQAKDKELVNALSKPDSDQAHPAIEALRTQITEIEGRLKADDARLERDFPAYAALARPKVVSGAEIHGLLAPDEALLFYMVNQGGTFVFAVTRESIAWNGLPLNAPALAERVAAFRQGLNVEDATRAIEVSGKSERFDLALAHDLYTQLITPVDKFLKDKRHLLIVPTGPLTALPFHLLVTEKPAAAVPDDLAGYRDAAWLIKRHAVTVLPSVESLKALRALPRKERASKPMIGFGDPIFAPEPPLPSQRAASPSINESTGADTSGKITGDAKMAAKNGATAGNKTRAYTDYWQGAGVDRDRLAASLPRLEDTADELKAVAKKLGAPTSAIHLRADASEATVKRASLADYRVVYFATHGLVAGDVKGLAEPSLALTLPAQPSELDDGLLTASEVAQLRLNADWVVLSACNTAAGDKPGAEALSGLVRAFFYAGARALLVSHWAVDSAAATRLTTATFDNLKADPNIGRAEAMRRAMLAYLNDRSNPLNAYPAFWGPFSVIGEGAAR